MENSGEKEKNILPKGAIAIKYGSNSKNCQNILTLPGTTLLVIPPNNTFNAPTVNSLKTTSSYTLNCLRPLSQSNEISSTANENSPQELKKGMKTMIALKKDKGFGIKTIQSLKGPLYNINKNEAKLHIPQSSIPHSENTCITSNIPDRLRHVHSQSTFSGNLPETMEVYAKNESLIEAKDNQCLFKERHQTVTEIETDSESSKPFYILSSSKDFYSNNSECISKTTDINLTNSGSANIPPSYETHVCNSAVKASMEAENGIEMAHNDFNGEIISLPLPYSHSAQENDISLDICHDSTSYSLSSSKPDNSTSLTSFYMPESIAYPNHGEPNAEMTTSTVNNINYLFESPGLGREYDSDPRYSAPMLSYNTNISKDCRLSGPSFDSGQWFLPHYEDEVADQPRDYSSHSGANSLLTKRDTASETVNCIAALVKNAKKQSLLKQENQSSYEERQKLALMLLNTPECERKKALREKFWIVEDEPLEESILAGKDDESLPSPDQSKSLPSKPLQPIDDDYICHICGKMLKGRSSLRTHIFLHLNHKPYECPYCLKKFTQGSTLRNHIRIHTGETPYSCYLCAKAFKTLSIMRKHLTKHSKSRDFECCICSKRFKSRIVLQSHLKIHLNGPHICRFCKTLFDSRGSLSTHVQRKHKMEKRFVCNICDKGYGSNCLLKQHMNIHSNEYKYSCHVCGASYVWKSGLAAHMRTHSFKIQCEMCGDKFISLKKLEKHRNRHSEPFPHKCSKCDRQFKFSNLLRKHLAKHKDELACHECGFGFMTKTKLKKHLKIHKGQS